MSSDCSQDRFVLDTLNYKKSGIWVELGCKGPYAGSNTHILEKNYDWSGISIDIDSYEISLWNGERNTNGLICSNALEIDYLELFNKYNLPPIFDYLSVDLEPPPITFEVLSKIPFNKYKFRVITFEHDHYRTEYASYELKKKSREFFLDLGYKMVPEHISSSYHSNINVSEDWYILN